MAGRDQLMSSKFEGAFHSMSQITIKIIKMTFQTWVKRTDRRQFMMMGRELSQLYLSSCFKNVHVVFA